jgi:long-chain acyl-CoA synthetase
LRTGDSGSVDADGSIRLSGRLKEVLIIDGQTYAPAEVEAALEAQRGVSEAAVVGTRSVGSTPVRGDRIVAFVTGEISPSDLSNVLAGCRSLLPPQLRPDEIRCVEILPRLSSGKLDRRTIRHWAMLPDPTP